jgi:hypothetical protein
MTIAISSNCSSPRPTIQARWDVLRSAKVRWVEAVFRSMQKVLTGVAAHSHSSPNAWSETFNASCRQLRSGPGSQRLVETLVDDVRKCNSGTRNDGGYSPAQWKRLAPTPPINRQQPRYELKTRGFDPYVRHGLRHSGKLHRNSEPFTLVPMSARQGCYCK